MKLTLHAIHSKKKPKVSAGEHKTNLEKYPQDSGFTLNSKTEKEIFNNICIIYNIHNNQHI